MWSSSLAAPYNFADLRFHPIGNCQGDSRAAVAKAAACDPWEAV